MAYNKSYHRFFEGYTEKKTYDAGRGRYEIKRTYTGDLYERQVEKKPFLLQRILYGSALLSALVSLILSGTDESAVVWYTVVPVGMQLLLWPWTAFYLYGYLIRGDQRLIIRQYRDRQVMCYTAMALGFADVLSCAAMIVYAVLIQKGLSLHGGAAILFSALSAVLLYRMYRRETDTVYLRISGSVPEDRDSYEIRYHSDDGL